MAVVEFIEFETRADLAKQLADDVAARLKPDLDTGTFGSIAFSGGSTPKLFLERFGQHPDIEKDMIYCALVDERDVPNDHERSNEKMIRDHAALWDHPDSEFLVLHRPGHDAADTVGWADTKLREDDELPFDVLLLGMGGDGHTASFFPDGNNLAAATDPATRALFMVMESPGVPDTRLTMTLPTIASADFLVLHIEGAEKRAVFERAMEDGPADDLPIRHVIRHTDATIHVYWAP